VKYKKSHIFFQITCDHSFPSYFFQITRKRVLYFPLLNEWNFLFRFRVILTQISSFFTQKSANITFTRIASEKFTRFSLGLLSVFHWTNMKTTRIHIPISNTFLQKNQTTLVNWNKNFCFSEILENALVIWKISLRRFSL
jgi:hypothetical protein